MPYRSFLIAVLGLSLGGASPAAAPAPPKKPDPAQLIESLTGGSTDALAGSIRGFLVRSMPSPLYENASSWGQTKPFRRIHWDGLRPEVTHQPKKDGKWRRLRVSAIGPADTLIFDIRRLELPEAGRLTFTVFLSLDARVEYEQENWRRGLKLYDGDVRARFRVRAVLDCEATFRLEKGSLLLPDAVFRLRVAHANVGYDNFETEHLAGLGGDAAEILGDALRGGVRQWRPELEHDLLDKLNTAIEKSADTKEVRLSLSKLLEHKGWLPKAKRQD